MDRRAGKRGLLALVVALILVLGGGYLGMLHPVGDSLAVFRAPGAAALALAAVLCLLLRAWRPSAIGFAVAAVSGAPLMAASRETGPAGSFVVYQKNLLFRNDDLPGIEADIRAIAPDVLTLQEVSTRNEVLLAGLGDVLPHQVLCPFVNAGGAAVLTRLEPVAGSEICAEGLAALQVRTPEGPVWLVSIHLQWPWPYSQAPQVDELVPVIGSLDGKMVIAGDFNLVSWSRAMARIRSAGRVKDVGPARGTFPKFGPLLDLPIDHVLAPGGGRTELRPLLGSDHRGLVGRLDL
jgi:endonuclease/exonuclease/phosphatase (EEP) superfamily protein YafD